MSEKESIRLAYLVSQYPAVSHTFIFREVRQLRKLGFNVSVASINETNLPKEGRSEEEKREIASTFYVKRSGITGAFAALLKTLCTSPVSFFRGLAFSMKLGGWDLKRLTYHFFYFVEALILGSRMRKEGLKHLHVHFANPASTVAFLASKIFPCTYSITIHGPDVFDDVSLNTLQKKIEGAKFIVGISKFACSQLNRLCPRSEWDKIENVLLGVDTVAFHPRPFRKKPSTYEILCVGRLVPAKGQHILLQAIKVLTLKGKDVRLRLIGEGPDKMSLKCEAAKLDLGARVMFEGALNHSEVLVAYQTADIFVLASFAEGIPVVLMEAMAMEIPCVSTRVAGIPELIQDEVDGLLVTPSDADVLANALERLIDDSDYRLHIGQTGRKRILEKFNLEHNTEKLGEVFSRRL